ncbi:MAG: TIGR01841 family phasin [Stellaceae bacterium]
MAKNVEVAQQTFEKSVSNVRELAELVIKANTDAVEVISKRVAEGLEELRDYAKKRIP